MKNLIKIFIKTLKNIELWLTNRNKIKVGDYVFYRLERVKVLAVHFDLVCRIQLTYGVLSSQELNDYIVRYNEENEKITIIYYHIREKIRDNQLLSDSEKNKIEGYIIKEWLESMKSKEKDYTQKLSDALSLKSIFYKIL